MGTWKHEHKGGIFYMHECDEQNEETKCITKFESKQENGSRGWGIDSGEGPIPIDKCPYCGLRLEPPEPEFDIEAYKEAAATMDRYWKAVMHDLMERTDRLFMGEMPEPPDKIEVSREMLGEWYSLLNRAYGISARHARAATLGDMFNVKQQIRALLDD